MTPDWIEPAVRGGAALAVFALLFLAARLRGKERGPDHGSADIGLD